MLDVSVATATAFPIATPRIARALRASPLWMNLNIVFIFRICALKSRTAEAFRAGVLGGIPDG